MRLCGYFLVALLMSSNVYVPKTKGFEPVTAVISIAALGTFGGYLWTRINYNQASRTLTDIQNYMGFINKQNLKELALIAHNATDAELVAYIGSYISNASEYTKQVPAIVRDLDAYQSAALDQFERFDEHDAKRKEAKDAYEKLTTMISQFKVLERVVSQESRFLQLCEIRNSLKKDDLITKLEQSNTDHAIRAQFAHEVFPYVAAYNALRKDRDTIKKTVQYFKNLGDAGATLSSVHQQVYQEVAQMAEVVDTKYNFITANPHFQSEKENAKKAEQLAQLAAAEKEKAEAQKVLAEATQARAHEEKRANDVAVGRLVEQQRVNDYNAEVARQGAIFEPERYRLNNLIAHEQGINRQLRQEKIRLEKLTEKLQQEKTNLEGIKANLEYKLAEQTHLHNINNAINRSAQRLADLYQALEDFEHNISQRCSKDLALKSWLDVQTSALKETTGLHQCSICTNVITANEFITSCNHHFHTACLHEHKVSSGAQFSCPYCRGPVNNSDLL